MAVLTRTPVGATSSFSHAGTLEKLYAEPDRFTFQAIHQFDRVDSSPAGIDGAAQVERAVQLGARFLGRKQA